MKKYFAIFLAIAILAAVCAFGAQLKPLPYPFIGRWQPSEDPLLIDNNGFQDIQNLRKDGARFKGVSGHSKINSTVWNATYKYPKNGFHFRKAQPAESHIILQAANAAGTAAYLYENLTAVPGAGNYSATAIHTDDSAAGLGRFSEVPQGSMLYCNGAESKIWGGNESTIVSFITSTTAIGDTITNPRDYSLAVSNTLTTGDQVAVIGGGNDTYTKLLLHCDGADGSTSVADASANGYTITVNGDAQIDTNQHRFGTAALLFDGTGDYVSAADSADWYMGSGKWTIDFWVYQGSGGALFEQYVDADNYIKCGVASPGTGEFYLKIRSGGANLLTLEHTTTPFFGNGWNHVAIICGWGGASDSVAYCLNGTAIQTGAMGGAWPDLAAAFEIGRITEAGPTYYYLAGHVDEFRITKGVARWTADFTLPARQYSDPALYWVVGATRPLQGVKFYVDAGNPISGQAVTAQEWSGGAWTGLTETDNTSGLTSTGTVTWESTVDTSKIKYLAGLPVYWYQFALSAGDATIYYVTADAPLQDVLNIWDGAEIPTVSAKLYEDSTYKDYTDEVTDDTVSYVAVLDGLTATTEYLLLGFLQPVLGFSINMPAALENSSAAILSVYYWDGEGWQSVTSLVDGTAVSGASLGKTGYVTFQAPERGTEFEQAISDELPLYYYKLVWSGNLDAEVEIFHISGVPTTDDIPGYKFPAMFQNRAWLFCETSGAKNKARYSAYNSPDIWNGYDSGSLYFGDETAITAAASIYNVFRTTGYEQLIIAKENATYRLIGDGPDNWEVTQMSGNIGCVAPLTMKVCEIADISQDSRRHVAIWQTDSGVVMCDGATIEPISHDIRCYWDPNDSRAIPASRVDDSVGWYNPDTQSYTLLISSGGGQTTHNVELEYSLKYKEWTKIYRENGSGANPLQVGFQVRDTAGVTYTYGATNEGYTYRLENGNTWDSTGIDQMIHTKDILLDNELPFFFDTTIDYHRIIFETKSTASTEDITISHYCDHTLTVDGSDNQAVPDAVDMVTGPINTQSVTLGPCLIHSLKYEATMSTVADGMEITGMGLYYESYETISE